MGTRGYLLSVGRAEIEQLTSGDNRQFDDEGVVGYLYEQERPGTAKLVRYSKDGDSRVGRESGAPLGRVDLTLQGFTEDGPMGYFVPQS
jgi:hypothetical protein